jgi:hypothetical protein
MRHLSLPAARQEAVAAAARARVFKCHTADHRAAEMEAAFKTAARKMARTA